ncbi:MAG: YciI family protein [Deltaproteobacteria bacterium]|nr:YciI family protein [Deltaproteobacteria bacterium]
MQYLLLIYTPENAEAAMPPAEGRTMMADYLTFTQNIRKAGNFVAGDALQPTHTATTVRVRDGKVTTTDGPFAETKEQLGGYYLINAKNLDEAITIAAQIPGAKHGSIEVRPIMVFAPSA